MSGDGPRLAEEAGEAKPRRRSAKSAASAASHDRLAKRKRL
jgi:hypothetical protein